MNKTQLVDALAARIGDRRTAATAVDGLLKTIMDAVGSGESVTLTGFGVFETRARAARVARNPRTGESVDVPATTVPAFRPGVGFRTAVGGVAMPAQRTSPARRPRSVAAAAVPAAAAAAEPARASMSRKTKATPAAKATPVAEPAPPAAPRRTKATAAFANEAPAAKPGRPARAAKPKDDKSKKPKK